MFMLQVNSNNPLESRAQRWGATSSHQAPVSSVLMVLYRYYVLLTSFSLPFSELSLVGLAFDMVD